MNCCHDARASSNTILICCVCSGKYHYECLNLTHQQYLSLNEQYKAAWKCPSCNNVTRRAQSNVNTPVRCTQVPVCDDTMDMSCDILERSVLNSSTSPKIDRSQTTEMPTNSFTNTEFEMFTRKLNMTLSNWRSDMNRDMIEIRDDIRSTLTEVQNEMKTLRAEQTLLKQRVSGLREDIVNLQTTVHSQSEQHDILKNQFEKLNCTESAELGSTVSNLETKIDFLEQQARQCNVEIGNLPEKRNEHLPSLIEAIGNALKSPIMLHDIVSVHRVPHAHQQNNRPKNVIVKFTTRLLRDNIISAFRKSKTLKTEQVGISGTSTSIYINEHLTLKKKQLFRRTREVAKKHGFKYVWIKNASILVRERDDTTAFAIRGESDLKKIRPTTN